MYKYPMEVKPVKEHLSIVSRLKVRVLFMAITISVSFLVSHYCAELLSKCWSRDDAGEAQFKINVASNPAILANIAGLWARCIIFCGIFAVLLGCGKLAHFYFYTAAQ